MIKKKSISYILASLFIVTLFSNITTKALAAENIKVTIDGKQVAFTQQPVVKDGRTLVPLRAIFEAMGYKVSWYEATQEVVASGTNFFAVKLKVGSTEASFGAMGDGWRDIILDVPPQIINGSTLVPARFIGESSGADVNWNESTKTVEIDRSKNREFTQICNEDTNYTKNIHCEGEWGYTGYVNKDYVPDGFGEFTYVNDLNKNTYINAYYIGTFVNGIKEGQGRFYYAEGSVYVGTFKNDGPNGIGTLTLWNGEKYIGEFVNGEMTGAGTYYYKNGTVKSGTFKNGEYVG